MDPGIIVMGMAVGALVGLTGVGGAALLTPVLLWLGISPSTAVATDLFYNSITKLFGGIQHMRQKTVDMKLVGYLALGSVPSGLAAVWLLQAYPPLAAHQDSIIEKALGVVLIVVALATIAKQFFERLGSNRWQEKRLEEKRLLTIGIGAVLGFIVGLTSIGSGSLFALAMIYLYRMQASSLVGTDIVHAFFLVSAAGGVHAFYGNIEYELAVNLLLGSVPGVVLGSRLSAKVPSKPLRTVMAGIILLSGLKLI